MKKYMPVFAVVCLSICILSCFAVAEQHQSSQSIIINGVTIVDVKRGTLRSNCRVTLSAETIQSISDAPPVSGNDESARIVNGKGMFLIPGLIDAHVHYTDPATFGPMMIANGVLFVRDMGNPTNDVIALRTRLKTREVFGPEMIVTGSILDGDPPLIPQIAIACKTPEKGREAVRKQVAAGVDEIKVYSGLPSDVFMAIVDEACKLGVKVVGHVPESVYIEDAADAGGKSWRVFRFQPTRERSHRRTEIGGKREGSHHVRFPKGFLRNDFGVFSFEPEAHQPLAEVTFGVHPNAVGRRSRSERALCL